VRSDQPSAGEMNPHEPTGAATPELTGVQVAFELFALASKMRGERHRREHPDATEEEIAAVIRAWQMERPGAEFGDAEGRVINWPRDDRDCARPWAPVACVGHLIALKLLARDDRRRPADADDLRALKEVATTADWEVAEMAVALISDRGYAKKRDLRVALDELKSNGAF
jgi:Rv0078B-related antitoxin